MFDERALLVEDSGSPDPKKAGAFRQVLTQACMGMGPLLAYTDCVDCSVNSLLIVALNQMFVLKHCVTGFMTVSRTILQVFSNASRTSINDLKKM